VIPKTLVSIFLFYSKSYKLVVSGEASRIFMRCPHIIFFLNSSIFMRQDQIIQSSTEKQPNKKLFQLKSNLG